MTPSQISVEQTRGRTPARRRMSKGAAKKSTKKRKAPASAVINLRTDTDTRALIDRAAAASGLNRTEFMLQSAHIQAEHVLLDQVYFELDDDDWAALNETLASPPPPNAALKRLAKSTPPWQV